MQLSLPLVRGYLRDLEARRYLTREHPTMQVGEHVLVYKRVARALKLTPTGISLVQDYHRELRETASKLLEADF